MWYVSIKVDVRLMFFPASWAQHDHMEVEMFPDSFFFPWLTSCVERSPYCEVRFIYFPAKGGEQEKHVISTWL